jgi:HlyD family secretion protein
MGVAAKVRRPVVLVPILLAIVGALLIGVRMLEGKRVTATVAERGELVQTVVSTGRVISPAKVEVGSLVLGTVAKIEAREGERVRRGQVMLRLADSEQRAALAQAQAVLGEAEARLVQLERLSAPVAAQSLRQAQANLELAEEEYRRTKRLFEQRFFSQATLDRAARDLETARAAVLSAQAQSMTTQPKGADFALAVSRRDQAKAAVEVARARLDYTVVRAPEDGVILRRMVEPGDVVPQGKVLYELAAGSETQVVLNVDEKNLGLLSLRQQAQVVADAYPGKPFAAEVFYIAPGVDPQRGTVEVKLRVADAPPFLRSDMTVSAEIIAGRRSDAIVIDSDAIRDAAAKTPWVLVVRDGRAVRQPVQLGLRGTGRTEIVAGVVPGEAIVPPAEASVRDGDRVRVVAPAETKVAPGSRTPSSDVQDARRQSA